MPDTFGDLRTSFDDLVGLDLDDDERDSLLNQAHRKLAAESEWYRATIELGPTVADQAAYDLPSDVYRVLSLKVSGRTYAPSDDQTAENLTQGLLRLNANGLWYRTFSAANVEQVSLYPVPGTAGLTISAQVVERPALMDDDADVPVVPEEQRQAIVDGACAVAFAGAEDNIELRAFYQEQFEIAKMELRRLRNKSGTAVRTWAVEGWTA